MICVLCGGRGYRVFDGFCVTCYFGRAAFVLIMVLR